MCDKAEVIGESNFEDLDTVCERNGTFGSITSLFSGLKRTIFDLFQFILRSSSGHSCENTEKNLN